MLTTHIIKDTFDFLSQPQGLLLPGASCYLGSCESYQPFLGWITNEIAKGKYNISQSIWY